MVDDEKISSEAIDLLRKITKARYIKLGEGDKYAKDCFREGNIKVQFTEISHEICASGGKRLDEEIDKQYASRSKRTRTRFKRILPEFYTFGKDVLWVTLVDNCLYWCFSKKGVNRNEDGTKQRKVIGAWYNTDIKGLQLDYSKISGRILAKRRAGLNTIVMIEDEADINYLKNKLLGESLPAIVSGRKNLQCLSSNIEKTIPHLSDKDAELLVDMIFSRAGLQRLGGVGGVEKSIDGEYLSLLTQEKFLIQVKARSGLRDFNKFKKYCESRTNNTEKLRCFYIVINPDEKLSGHVRDTDTSQIQNGIDIKILVAHDLADLALDYGFSRWVMDKGF